MAHDQSIAQALSIFHIHEEAKGQKETLLFILGNGLNMEVNGSYLLLF